MDLANLTKLPPNAPYPDFLYAYFRRIMYKCPAVLPPVR